MIPDEEPTVHYYGATITNVSIEIDPQAVMEIAASKILQRLELKRDEGYRSLDERFGRITDEEIRAHIAPQVQAAISTPKQPTTVWGEPSGAPITLAETIQKAVHDLLNKETGEYNRRETFIRKFIREEVEKAVKADLNGAMEAARAEVRAAVKDQAAGLLAQTIEKMAVAR